MSKILGYKFNNCFGTSTDKYGTTIDVQIKNLGYFKEDYLYKIEGELDLNYIFEYVLFFKLVGGDFMMTLTDSKSQESFGFYLQRLDSQDLSVTDVTTRISLNLDQPDLPCLEFLRV